MSWRLLPWRRGPSQFQQAADGSMTLVDHLKELRSRLFKATLAVGIGMVVGYFVAQQVFDFLAQPYCDLVETPDGECGWNWLAPTDSFFLRLKIALWIGLIIAAPFWLYQLWAFVAPGLHRRERRWAYGFGALSLPLFAGGTALAYFVLDRGLRFLSEYGVANEPAMLEPTRYISFVTVLILAFGISFQFPVLLLLLNFSGLVSAQKLLRAWRVVVFCCFLFAATFTPDPGPFGMLLMAASLCALYAAALGVAFLHDRRVARRRGPDDDALPEGLDDDATSPLAADPSPLPPEELEPVGAPGEPVGPTGPVPQPRPLDRRYDDLI